MKAKMKNKIHNYQKLINRKEFFVKSIRKKLHLTQREMAVKLHISVSYYQKVEAGFVKPGRGFIEKFMVAFPKEDINLLFFSGND
jgi:transcriptional regulator with XRE-family HTH domain